MNLLSLALLPILGFLSEASVLDTAKANGCSKLADLVSKAGLASALNSANDVTLFAPSDAAINNIPADVLDKLSKNQTLLQEVLKYHVVSEVKMAADLKNDELLPTLAKEKLRTNIYNGKTVTAEGSVVSKPDLQASNGVVHVIDKVIYPLPSLSLPVYLNFDLQINTMGYLVYQAKLIDDLMEQNLTMFAPTNTAIAKLPGQEYNDLLMNITELKAVLGHHLVKGTLYSAGLRDGQKLKTLHGTDLMVKIGADGTVTVDGAKVLTVDINTLNGAIHVIDTLLFPPNSHSSPVG